MRKTSILLILYLFTKNLHGQVSYIGFINKSPIELVTHIYSDGIANAFYVYSNFDEPINIDGTLKNGLLTLIEKDSLGKAKATLIFNSFNIKNKNIEGVQKDLNTGKELKITLCKTFDVDTKDTIEWKNMELLQPVSLKDKYFKLILHKENEADEVSVSGIKIFEKKTDKLIQQIECACQLLGLYNVNIDDYNFDGLPDFSVFEQSYAGPNTSSLYFLYNKKTNTYFDSGFTGTSLEFSSSNKRVYERNQCCAGTSITRATYKVVKNKMILLKEQCFKWDEKKQKLVEHKMKDCQ